MSGRFRFLVQDFAHREVKRRDSHLHPVARLLGRVTPPDGTPVGGYFMPIIELGAKSPRVYHSDDPRVQLNCFFFFVFLSHPRLVYECDRRAGQDFGLPVHHGHGVFDMR